MAATKYKEYFSKMQEQNKELFAEFLQVHQDYEADQKKHGVEFHQVGQKVVDVIRDWDRRLCSAMGRGAFSKYSEKLSEKFWGEAKKIFPFIYSVGVKNS